MKKILILALLATGLHAQCNLKRGAGENTQLYVQSCLMKEANEIENKRLRMEREKIQILKDIHEALEKIAVKGLV